MSQSFTLSDCGYLATAVASAVVEQYGPRLPRQRYAQILHQMISQQA
jgi:sugar/nucleoside kinase (ribokinase family)